MSVYEFQRHLADLRRPLYWFALSLTKDRDDAQDLVQESMLRALTYRERFADNTNFKAWLCTIMKNTFINAHRRGQRKSALIERVTHEHAPLMRLETAASTESTVKLREIHSSLEQLGHTFREPFQMHHDGYKYHEIADKLGIPIGTVKSRIHQARLRLMSMLTDRTEV